MYFNESRVFDLQMITLECASVAIPAIYQTLVVIVFRRRHVKKKFEIKMAPYHYSLETCYTCKLAQLIFWLIALLNLFTKNSNR